MPEEQSKSSYDLDWMLQSEKVSDADLARALTKTYYVDIFQLSNYFIDDKEKAEKAAREAVADAIRHRSQFWGTDGLQIWIYRRAVRICRKSLGVLRRKTGKGGKENRFTASLKSSEKYLLLLRYGLGLGADEIASLMNQPEEKVRSRLKYLRSKTGIRQVDVEIPEQEKHEAVVELEKKADGLEIVGGFTGYEEHLRNCSICRAAVEYLKDADEYLENAAAEAYPKPNLTEGQILAAARDIVNSAAVYGEKKRVSLRLKEIGFVLGAIVLAGIVIFSGQLLAPVEPPRPEIIYIPITATAIPNKEVFNGSVETNRNENPFEALESLSYTSTLEEVLNRVRNSSELWERLWVDSVVIDYGPVGYIGPPQVYYNRIWIRKPNSILVLGGHEEIPDYLLLYTGYNFYERAMGSTFRFSLSGSDLSQLRLQTEFPFVENPAGSGTLFGYQIHNMLYPAASNLFIRANQQGKENKPSEFQSGWVINDPIDNGLDFWMTGLQNVYGREAISLVISSSEFGRIAVSIDTKTGMVLRWREFSKTIPGEMIREMVITSIRYNPDFPDYLMDTRLITQDVTWDGLWIPDDADIRPPKENFPPRRMADHAFLGASIPEWFDPSSAVLSFQYVEASELDDRDTWEAIIFANQYPLPTFPVVGDPWNLVCTRSPDGSWISVAQDPTSETYETGEIYWTDLINPGITVKPVGSRFGLGTAFSPDSKNLVFSQTGWVGSPQGVFLYDLETYQVRMLMDIPFAAFFTWKPDSKQVTFFGGERTTDLLEYVVDVESSEIMYEAEASIQNRKLNPESPAADWGVQFPPEYGGLESCVDP